MAVRLPSGAAYAPQVLKEYHWLPILAPSLPLPIPVPIALGAACDSFAWQWSVYEWLPGEAADTARVSDTRQLARSVGRFLSAMQGLDPAGGPSPGRDNFHRGAPLSVYDSETRRALSLLAGTIDVRAAGAVWEAAIACPPEHAPVWLHGDVSLGNLLVHDGELSAVIDFGCLAVGDPSCDLAFAWALDREAREAFRASVPADEQAWKRGRGWALWKALVQLAGVSTTDPAAVEESHRTVQRILSD